MRNIYTSIDIGTDSVRLLTQEYYNGKYNVLASAIVASSGVKKGLIYDANALAKEIKKGIKELESKLGCKINKALAIVPSNNLNIDISSASISNNREDKIISGEMVFNCMQKSLKNVATETKEIVGVFPTSYVTSDEKEIFYPIGAISDSLKMKDVVLTVPNKNVYSVLSVLKSVGIDVIDVCISSVCDYHTVKTKDMDNKVIAMIDIGLDKTLVSVFNKGVLMKEGSLPVGGKNIDSDISFAYNITSEESKYIKENFAVCNRKYADNTLEYEIKNKNGEVIAINQYKLADLIETRVITILKSTKTFINGLTNKEIGYIIVTGGITSMLGFTATIEDVFPRNVSCLNMNVIGIRDNRYSSCLGMIKYFYEKLELREKSYTMLSDDEIEEMLLLKKKTSNNSGTFSKIFGKIFD